MTSYQGQKTSNPAAAVTTKPDNGYATSTAEKETTTATSEEAATTTPAPQTTPTVSMTTTASPQETSTASNQEIATSTVSSQGATTTAIPETTATVSMTTTAAPQETSANQETATTTVSSQETTATTERLEATTAPMITTASSDESVVPTRLPSTNAAQEAESTTKQQSSNQNPSTAYPGTAKQGSQNATTSSNTYTAASETESKTSGTTTGSQTTETASQTTSQNAETTTPYTSQNTETTIAYKPTQAVTDRLPNTESNNETTTRPAEDTTTSAETSLPTTTQNSETTTAYQSYKTDNKGSTTTSTAVNNATPTRPVGTSTSTESNSATTDQTSESTTSNQTAQTASESTSKAPTRPVGTTKALTDTGTSGSTTSASTEGQKTTETSVAGQPSENSGTGTTTKPTKATVVVFTNERNGEETTTASNNQATTTASPYPSYQETTTTSPYNQPQFGTDKTSTTSARYPGGVTQYQETTTTATEKPKEVSTSEPGVSVEEPNLNTTTAPNTYPQQSPAQVAATAGRYPGTENPYPATAPQIAGNQPHVGQITSEEPKTTTAPAGVSVEEPSTIKPQTARQQSQNNSIFTQTLYTSQRLRYYTWYEEVESNDTDSDVTQTMTPQPSQHVNNGQASNQSNLITSAATSNQNNAAPQAPSNQASAAPSYQPSNNGSIYLEGKENEELVYEPNPYAAATTAPRPEITTTILPQVYQALAQTTTTTKSPYIVATTANQPAIAQAQGSAQQSTAAQDRPLVNTNATAMPTKALPEAYQALAETTTTTNSPYIVATTANVPGNAQPQGPGQQVTAAQNSPLAQANATASKAPAAETTQPNLDYLEGKEADETIIETLPPTQQQQSTTSSTPAQPNPPAQPQGSGQQITAAQNSPLAQANATASKAPIAETTQPNLDYLEGKDANETIIETLPPTQKQQSTTSRTPAQPNPPAQPQGYPQYNQGYTYQYNGYQYPTGSPNNNETATTTPPLVEFGVGGKQQDGYLEGKNDTEAMFANELTTTPQREGTTTMSSYPTESATSQAGYGNVGSLHEANVTATAQQIGTSGQEGGYLEEKEDNKAVYGVAATPPRIGETTQARAGETTTPTQPKTTTNWPKYPTSNVAPAAQTSPTSQQGGYLEEKQDNKAVYGAAATQPRLGETMQAQPGETTSPTQPEPTTNWPKYPASNVTTAAQANPTSQEGGYLEEKEDNKAVYGTAETQPRLGETTQAPPGETTTSTQPESTTNWPKYPASNVATAAQASPTSQQGGYLEEKDDNKTVYGTASAPPRVGETTPPRPGETTTAIQTETTTNGPKFPGNNATSAAQLQSVEPTPDTKVTNNITQTQAAASNNAGYLEGKEDNEVLYGNNENQGTAYMAQSSKYPSAYETSKAQPAPQNGNQGYYGGITQGGYNGSSQQSGMDNVQGYETTTTATTTALPLVTTTIATAATTTQYPYRYDNSNNNNYNSVNNKENGAGSDEEAETESENPNGEEKANGDLSEESKIEQDASTGGQQDSRRGESSPQSSQSQANQTGSTQSISDLESQDVSQGQSDNGPPTPPPYYPQETTQPTTQQYTTTPAYGNQRPNFVATTTKAPPVYQGNGVEYMEGKESEDILYRTTTPPPIYQQGLPGKNFPSWLSICLSKLRIGFYQFVCSLPKEGVEEVEQKWVYRRHELQRNEQLYNILKFRTGKRK